MLSRGRPGGRVLKNSECPFAGAQNLLEFFDVEPDDRLAQKFLDGFPDQGFGRAAGGFGHGAVHRFDTRKTSPDSTLSSISMSDTEWNTNPSRFSFRRSASSAACFAVTSVRTRILPAVSPRRNRGGDGNIEVQGAPAGRSAGKRQIPDSRKTLPVRGKEFPRTFFKFRNQVEKASAERFLAGNPQQQFRRLVPHEDRSRHFPSIPRMGVGAASRIARRLSLIRTVSFSFSIRACSASLRAWISSTTAS